MSKLIENCLDVSRALSCTFKIQSADSLTTFKGGGSACVFYPDSELKFIELFGALNDVTGAPFILGGGSDTVLADGLCAVPIISTKRLDGVEIVDGRAKVLCGAYISKVISELRRHNLGGLEFLSGIPATAGGVTRMNAGAFNAQTADYIDEIRILSADSGNKTGFNAVTVKRSDYDFGYRKGVTDTVLSVTFKADKMDREQSLKRAAEFLEVRARKQPKLPSCGSVFKNGETPSGKLIEGCGLKGARIGGAKISEMHGNFIVNTGGASASDFMALVSLAEQSVYDKFGVRLEREFVYLK